VIVRPIHKVWVEGHGAVELTGARSLDGTPTVVARFASLRREPGHARMPWFVVLYADEADELVTAINAAVADAEAGP